MNAIFHKYLQKGQNLSFDPLQHKQKFVIKSTKEKEFQVLWTLCKNMEKKALNSFRRSSPESKFDVFFKTARKEYILRPGYHRVMKNLVLKEVSLFVASDCISPITHSKKDIYYVSQLFVDGIYVTYSFVFGKQ